MSGGRYVRFRDRGSYRSSEVVGLFIISIMGGMLFCCICFAIDYFLSKVLHVSG
jgi:hypothetical protein